MNLFLLSLFIKITYVTSACNSITSPNNQSMCDTVSPSNSNFKCVYFEGECREMTKCEANNYLSEKDTETDIETEPTLDPQHTIRRRMSTICSGSTHDDGFLEFIGIEKNK